MGPSGDGFCVEMPVGSNYPHGDMMEQLQDMDKMLRELQQQTKGQQARCSMLEIDMATSLMDPEFLEAHAAAHGVCENHEKRLREELNEWDEMIKFMKMDPEDIPMDEDGRPKFPWKTSVGDGDDDKNTETDGEKNPMAEVDKAVDEFKKVLREIAGWEETDDPSAAEGSQQGAPDAQHKEDASGEEVEMRPDTAAADREMTRFKGTEAVRNLPAVSAEDTPGDAPDSNKEAADGEVPDEGVADGNQAVPEPQQGKNATPDSAATGADGSLHPPAADAAKGGPQDKQETAGEA